MVIENYKHILDLVKNYADKYSRDINDIKLLPVSKGKPVEDMEQLVNFGVREFGESRIQEAKLKIERLKKLDVDIKYHFIGNIQSNKIKKIVSQFSLIQSVDSVETLISINRNAFYFDKVQEILVQLNLAGEKQKGGISEDDIDFFVENIINCSNIKLNGFMVIPPKDEKLTKFTFERAKLIYDKYKKIVNVDTLSMGMSSDIELAIANGTTMLRIGTAIFND